MRQFPLRQAALRRAIAVSPRSHRAQELLNITARARLTERSLGQVGTQSFSPLFWAIDSGSLNSANAMLQASKLVLDLPCQDLLTIRADREVYYYGSDAP